MIEDLIDNLGSTSDHYAKLYSLLDEIKVHQPPMTNFFIQNWYQDELAIAVYLSRLNTSIGSQIWGHVLVTNILLSLIDTFYKVIQVLTGITPPTTTQTLNDSVMVSMGSKGRG